MHLIFWHNIISPHQAPFMRCLADAGHEVLVVATETMSADRRKLGWSVPSLGRAKVVVNPSLSQIRGIVQESPPDSVHFIAGARGTPLGDQVGGVCREYGRRTGIITEAPDMRGIGGMVRRLKYRAECRRAGTKFDFLLAMGEKGVRWFGSFGYASDKLFPFAYVTDSHHLMITSPNKRDRFRFLFVGQMIQRKGVDVLLRALASVPGCELALIGNGDDLASLQSLAEELLISHRITWMGQIDSQRIPECLLDSKMLVLPSREDGWGAVVNEALMVGIPVICSDACGAAELIRQKWLGGVFRSGNVEDLAALLHEWAGKEPSGNTERERIRNWSRCITGPSVAAYLEEILEHVYQAGGRPVAPWRKENQ